jgi:hypothetical protein
MTTYRERREAKAERLREWAAKREERAADVFKAGEVYRGDHAFNFQPGHIPERARVIAREDRAHESVRKADRMSEKADNIEAQLAASIYDDDPDAIEALERRLAALEAARARYTAFNRSARKGAPDFSLLSPRQFASWSNLKRFGMLRKDGAFPAYATSNLSGRISKDCERLARLRREAGRSC